MAEMVLIEGSRTPSVWLPRGQRRIVPWTRAVRKLADRGYIVVVARVPVTLGRHRSE